MKVAVPIVDQQCCNWSYHGRIYDVHVCAGYVDGGKDSCQVRPCIAPLKQSIELLAVRVLLGFTPGSCRKYVISFWVTI